MFLELFRKLHKPQSKITKESSNQVKFEPKKSGLFRIFVFQLGGRPESQLVS